MPSTLVEWIEALALLFLALKGLVSLGSLSLLLEFLRCSSGISQLYQVSDLGVLFFSCLSV